MIELQIFFTSTRHTFIELLVVCMPSKMGRAKVVGAPTRHCDPPQAGQLHVFDIDGYT